MKVADQPSAERRTESEERLQGSPLGDEPTLFPGKIVGGKYRLQAHLGRGGMGTVFRAEHTSLGKAYALKFLRYRDGGRHSLRRFEREAQLLAKLEHENIVTLIDIGTDADAPPYLVLELISGRTLADELEHGALPLGKAVVIATQIARALGMAHEVGVIHRDLKPANVMLTEHADGRSWIKLLDFGVARLYETDHDHGDTLTATGHAPGTAAYMSPEQARGEASLDARSDVYALGVVVYESLSGKRPYDGRTYNQILFKILNHEHAPLAELCPHLPDGVCVAVERALAKHARERFASPWEFALALQSAAQGESSETDATLDLETFTHDGLQSEGAGSPASSPTPTPSRSAVSASPSVPRLVALIGSGAVGLVVGALFASGLLRDAGSTKVAPPSPSAVMPSSSEAMPNQPAQAGMTHQVHPVPAVFAEPQATASVELTRQPAPTPSGNALAAAPPTIPATPASRASRLPRTNAVSAAAGTAVGRASKPARVDETNEEDARRTASDPSAPPSSTVAPLGTGPAKLPLLDADFADSPYQQGFPR